ncbi:MAG TPA: hypothetical protein VL346_11395, partial [Acidobacteriaceae bacterium]|nr:hypothetical protein [Acidobacteriaceae bacterium]
MKNSMLPPQNMAAIRLGRGFFVFDAPGIFFRIAGATGGILPRMAEFPVNPQRFDPYKNFKFRLKWDGKYVA